ncbi:hypothetical protein ACS5PU_22095 [Pedobacter sp. GSP4]|uniref:hypothetical protein n=1 Tax=Pedobacter sp. GSP4 TaxID=3453716 RepID=UPI003EEB1AE2
MDISAQFQQFYDDAKRNKWFRVFTIFCRVALAASFIPSGIVKIMGERFTALPNNHPLGHYFDALHATGYYYNFIGVSQLVIALLLLIPRTALLGALAYLPVIINICVLTYATRFEGTRIITIMLLANVYLLFWDYKRLRAIVWTERLPKEPLGSKFPLVFLGFIVLAIAAVIISNQFLYEIRPGNSVAECQNQSAGNKNPKGCKIFCDCIYRDGKPLDTCLKIYEKAKVRGKQ